MQVVPNNDDDDWLGKVEGVDWIGLGLRRSAWASCDVGLIVVTKIRLEETTQVGKAQEKAKSKDLRGRAEV
jgi:hypothetical protein